MKTKVFIMLMLQCFMSAEIWAIDAENHMVFEGKTWKGFEYDAEGNRYQYDYYLSGDTVIDGEVFMKCYCYSERAEREEMPGTRFVGSLREENGKVYGRINGNTVLLYDFSLKPGDFLYCDMSNPDECTFAHLHKDKIPAFDIKGTNYFCAIILKDIDTVYGMDNVPRRRFNFVAQRTEILEHDIHVIEITDAVHWIEGVGAENYNPFLTWDTQFNTSYKYQLEECYFNKTNLFSRTYTTGIALSPDTQSSTAPANLYDLQGRRIQGEPQGKGIYVKNGKKFVMK